jgi:sporulation protein YlmC with PRC-barrel domain
METHAHETTGHMGTRNRRVVSADTMTGDSVRNLSGDDLGNVQGIMLDVYDGSIAYAVLSFGGFLGMGDKLFAVPWKALTLVQDEQHFTRSDRPCPYPSSPDTSSSTPTWAGSSFGTAAPTWPSGEGWKRGSWKGSRHPGWGRRRRRSDEAGEGLARDLEAMGPTFVKAGQLLSTRPDLLPVEYLLALSRLQDEVEPFDSEEAERILAEELGVRISKAFSRFDSEPIASASLGQVHYAEMRDGRPVAVKIQRPGVRQQVASDLEAIEEIAEVMAARTELGERFDLVAMVGEFRKTSWTSSTTARRPGTWSDSGRTWRSSTGCWSRARSWTSPPHASS